MKILVSFFAAFLLLAVGSVNAQATAANTRLSASVNDDSDDLTDLNDDSDEIEGMLIAGMYNDLSEDDADYDMFVLGNEDEDSDLDLEMDADDDDFDPTDELEDGMDED